MHFIHSFSTVLLLVVKQSLVRTLTAFFLIIATYNRTPDEIKGQLRK